MPEPVPEASLEGEAMVFEEGARVEVTSKEDGLAGAWFEARVRRVLRGGKLLVQYDQLLDEADPSRHLCEEVYAFFVRPQPPLPAVPAEFRSGDSVEAFIRDAWWVGQVVEAISDSLFVVQFPDGDKLKIPAAELRKHLEWVVGSWRIPDKLMEDVSEMMPKRKRGRPPKNSRTLKQCFPIEGAKKRKGNISSLHILQSCEEHELEADASKVSIDTPSQENTTRDCSQASVNEITSKLVNDYVSSSNCAPKGVVKANGVTESPKADLTPLHARISEELGEETTNDSLKCPKVLTESEDEPRQMIDLLDNQKYMSVPETAIIETSLEPLTVCSFTKVSPIWEVIFSMDIFCKLPQHPHFHPLEKFSEERREAKALGLMVEFANLANNIRTTEHDMPLSVLEERLEALEDLKQHGFNVEAIKTPLEDFIQVKKNYDQLKPKLVELKEKIIENEKRCSMSGTKINDIDKKVNELEHEIAILRAHRAAAETTKVIFLCEKLRLESRFQELQEENDKIVKSMDNIVARVDF